MSGKRFWSQFCLSKQDYEARIRLICHRYNVKSITGAEPSVMGSDSPT